MAILHTTEKTRTEKISSFLIKHARKLIISAAVIAAAIVIVGIVTVTASNRLEKQTAEVELLAERYAEIIASVNAATAEEEEIEGSSADSDADSDLELQSFAEELKLFIAGARKGYPQLRARYLLASLHYRIEEYQQSAEEFLAIADDYPESHLAPSSLMNAGAALELAEQLTEAAARYEAVYTKYGTESSTAPRALFSAGRLHEKIGNIGEAVRVFDLLSEKYPASEWAKLAVSRLIALE